MATPQSWNRGVVIKSSSVHRVCAYVPLRTIYVHASLLPVDTSVYMDDAHQHARLLPFLDASTVRCVYVCMCVFPACVAHWCGAPPHQSWNRGVVFKLSFRAQRVCRRACIVTTCGARYVGSHAHHHVSCFLDEHATKGLSRAYSIAWVARFALQKRWVRTRAYVPVRTYQLVCCSRRESNPNLLGGGQPSYH